MLVFASVLLAAQAAKPIVTFKLTAAAAQKVEFAGDLVSWDSPKPMHKQGDTWTVSFPLSPKARFEYKFIVDGKWIEDPNDPKQIDNGVGGKNSVYEGPAYRSNVPDSPPVRPLQRATYQIGGREIIVYSPPHPSHLPIFVFADGPMYERFGHVQNIVENLIEAHRIRPVVLALVPPNDRMKEYGADWRPYGEYLFNEVLPKVRHQTGASEKARDLYLGGSSLGGVIALRLAEEFPDKVAGGIESQSGAFQFRPLNIKFSDLTTKEAFTRLAPTTKLWFDWGVFESTLTKANEDAMGVLWKMKRPFASETTDEGHNWTAWRNRMADGLCYLLRPR